MSLSFTQKRALFDAARTGGLVRSPHSDACSASIDGGRSYQTATIRSLLAADLLVFRHLGGRQLARITPLGWRSLPEAWRRETERQGETHVETDVHPQAR